MLALLAIRHRKSTCGARSVRGTAVDTGVVVRRSAAARASARTGSIEAAGARSRRMACLVPRCAMGSAARRRHEDDEPEVEGARLRPLRRRGGEGLAGAP